MSAVELMGSHRERAGIYETLMERNRLWRFVKERAAAIAQSIRNRTKRNSYQKGDLSYER